ncbi:hypothetical protein BpHYR1_000784 [Brachionus plicatilis]|uniref:Uncharacterized protein n=1 Tax=Brachionus plicatilis TaxID=10195 RepID=A0A3M7QN01_BRAPC|nr:hypothetical protein BpHYR1_000784 [Brachionus plicatilis]
MSFSDKDITKSKLKAKEDPQFDKHTSTNNISTNRLSFDKTRVVLTKKREKKEIKKSISQLI